MSHFSLFIYKLSYTRNFLQVLPSILSSLLLKCGHISLMWKVYVTYGIMWENFKSYSVRIAHCRRVELAQVCTMNLFLFIPVAKLVLAHFHCITIPSVYIYEWMYNLTYVICRFLTRLIWPLLFQTQSVVIYVAIRVHST